MRGVCVGAERPVERLARRAGYEIADAPHCLRGHVYQVGGRVIILAPTWLPGVDVREGIVSRQMVLYGLATSGEEAFAAGLAAMTARNLARHAAPLDGLAAD